MAELDSERRVYMRQINRQNQFVQEQNLDTIDESMLEATSELIQTAWQKFMAAHNQLVKRVDKKGIVKAEKLMKNTEKTYLESRAVALRALKARSTADSSGANGSLKETKGEKPIYVQAPKALKVPRFDGNMANWQAFHSQFMAEIHENDSLSKYEKFAALKEAFADQNELGFGTWSLVADEYDDTWKNVCATYNDTHHLKQFHLSSLIGSPPMNTNTAPELRRVLTAVNCSTRALKALGEPTEQWGTIVSYLITSKLHPIMFEKWERFRDDKTEVPVADLLEFCEKEVKRLIRATAGTAPMAISSGGKSGRAEASPERSRQRHRSREHDRRERSRSRDRRGRREHRENHERRGNEKRRNRSSQRHHRDRYDDQEANRLVRPKVESVREPAATNARPANERCPVCKLEGHEMAGCGDLERMDMEDVQKEVIKAGTCYNCLLKGHMVRRCPAPPCRICNNNQRHHRLLCPVHHASKSAAGKKGERSTQ